MLKPTTEEKELVVNRVFEHILAVNDMSKLLKVEEALQKRSDKKKEQKLIRKHARRDRLQALLADPAFNEQLICAGGCIYEISKRIIYSR